MKIFFPFFLDTFILLIQNHQIRRYISIQANNQNFNLNYNNRILILKLHSKQLALFSKIYFMNYLVLIFLQLTLIILKLFIFYFNLFKVFYMLQKIQEYSLTSIKDHNFSQIYLCLIDKVYLFHNLLAFRGHQFQKVLVLFLQVSLKVFLYQFYLLI